MSPGAHRVTILALPSVVPFDLGVPIQVFGYPRPDLGARRYAMTVCGAKRGRVLTSGGFSIVVEHGLEALTRAQTIVVPGIDDLTLPIAPAVCRALAAAYRRGARMVSICTGAFALAEAGLLTERRATTHWIDAPAFAARFPQVRLDPDVLYIDEGNVLTSAGVASGIDLCLHIVRKDHGASVANAVARRLVVAPHRSGGQAQFVAQPVAAPTGRRLEATRSWITERLAEPISVTGMAGHARMSLRTFARRFAEETGTSPLQWLLRHRILAAQQLLEQSDQSVDSIAAACGFGSAMALRIHFRRELSTSPLAYRRAFRESVADRNARRVYDDHSSGAAPVEPRRRVAGERAGLTAARPGAPRLARGPL